MVLSVRFLIFHSFGSWLVAYYC